jgi:transcriptional regulator with PAS, ATPase and Fis domain
LLVDYLLHKLNRELQKKVSRIETRALEQLAAYDWPGNIRQLENTLRRAVVHNQGDLLTADGVAEAMQETVKSGSQSRSSAIKLLDEVEKEHILNALKFAGGNRGRVCELLGISRPTLQRKIRKYQIRL